MSYEVRISRPAARDLQRLGGSTERRIRARFGELAESPFDRRRSKPLIGIAGLRSSRVGDWRILYRVNEADQAVEIIAVGPRGDAYRRL